MSGIKECIDSIVEQKRAGAELKTPNKRGLDVNDIRNIDIYFLSKSGKTISEIGKGKNLANGRIRSILNMVEENFRNEFYQLFDAERFMSKNVAQALRIKVIVTKSYGASFVIPFVYHYKNEYVSKLEDWVRKALVILKHERRWNRICKEFIKEARNEEIS